MDEEMKARTDLERGQRAQQLLDNPLFVEVFAELERKYIQGWRESEPRDDDGRERVWLALQVLGKVKTDIQAIATDGSAAATKLAVLELQKQRQPRRHVA